MNKYRLSAQEIRQIHSCIQRLDGNAKVFLYGSRLDTNTKGGDLDLLVISETLTFTDKLDILSELKEKLGDQKIDLSILSRIEYDNSKFFQSINKVQIP